MSGQEMLSVIISVTIIWNILAVSISHFLPIIPVHVRMAVWIFSSNLSPMKWYLLHCFSKWGHEVLRIWNIEWWLCVKYMITDTIIEIVIETIKIQISWNRHDFDHACFYTIFFLWYSSRTAYNKVLWFCQLSFLDALYFNNRIHQAVKVGKWTCDSFLNEVQVVSC